MNAEIVMKEREDGNTEVRIVGMASDIIPMVLRLVDEVATLHAQQVGASRYASLMAMADTIRDIARDCDDEDGGLS